MSGRTASRRGLVVTLLVGVLVLLVWPQALGLQRMPLVAQAVDGADVARVADRPVLVGSSWSVLGFQVITDTRPGSDHRAVVAVLGRR
ncbi:hypothetical protein OR221_0574 [Microbacterium laevaniformans OR221]|nr:hypothetical protein OR221_0574 [Microbacterium laevaniformans OR221]